MELLSINLTLSSFGIDEPRVGGHSTIDDVELEVTGTRIPCRTFQAQMNLAGWAGRFRALFEKRLQNR